MCTVFNTFCVLYRVQAPYYIVYNIVYNIKCVYIHAKGARERVYSLCITQKGKRGQESIKTERYMANLH